MVGAAPMIALPVLLRSLAPWLAEPVAEYRFLEKRRFRFDFAWPGQLVAVELDGGQWVAHGGRHNRDSDRVKKNLAAAHGWRVLAFSNQQIEREPAQCVELIATALAFVGETVQ